MTETAQDTQETVQCEYCQKEITNKRLTLSFLLSDASNNLFNLERGLIFTFWSLIRRPGEVVQEFVSGNRHRFMNPFRFLLVAATLTVIAEALSDSTAMFALFDIKGTDDDSTAMVQDIMANYLNFIILLTVPFYAFGSWLVFRKPKWNLAEHLVVNAYGISMTVILSSIVTLLTLPLGEETMLLIGGMTQVFNLYLVYIYVKSWR
jgi:hypothetical protein